MDAYVRNKSRKIKWAPERSSLQHPRLLIRSAAHTTTPLPATHRRMDKVVGILGAVGWSTFGGTSSHAHITDQSFHTLSIE